MRPTAGDEEREALQVGCPSGHEVWQLERGAERTFGVAQDWKRQAKAHDKLALVSRLLAAQAEEPQIRFGEIGMTVAKAFELGRRTMRARDQIPIGRIGRAGAAGPGINDDDAAPLNHGEIRRQTQAWR